MNLIVLTPDKKIFEGVVSSVKVPGTSGIFEVLNGHAPIVSSLQRGEIKLTLEGGNNKTFSIEDGFIEVLYNDVSLLVTGVTE